MARVKRYFSVGYAILVEVSEGFVLEFLVYILQVQQALGMLILMGLTAQTHQFSIILYHYHLKKPDQTTQLDHKSTLSMIDFTHQFPSNSPHYSSTLLITNHFPLNSPHYSSILLITSQIPSDLLHSTQTLFRSPPFHSHLLHSTQISSALHRSPPFYSIPLRYPPIHSLLLKSPQFPSSSPHNLISFLLGSIFLFLIILLFE